MPSKVNTRLSSNTALTKELFERLARWMNLWDLEKQYYKYSESQHSSGEYQYAFLGEDPRYDVNINIKCYLYSFKTR